MGVERLYLFAIDGFAIDVGTMDELEHSHDVSGAEVTVEDETMRERDLRAARMRRRGLSIGGIAELMDVSLLRVKGMLARVDNGRWNEE